MTVSFNAWKNSDTSGDGTSLTSGDGTSLTSPTSPTGNKRAANEAKSSVDSSIISSNRSEADDDGSGGVSAGEGYGTAGQACTSNSDAHGGAKEEQERKDNYLSSVTKGGCK
jgi:hypothetical protein